MKKESVLAVEKRSCFSVKDSSINFMLALIVPFVASLALIILFMFLASATGNNYNDFIKTEFVEVVNLMFTPIVFFFIYFIYTKKFRFNVFEASQISFKVNPLKIVAVIIIGVASVFLISPFISLVDYGFSLIGYNPANSLPYVMNNGWRFVLGVIAMAVLPAICEELLFRGLIFRGLQSKFSSHFAVLISALMFTLLHGSLQQTVYQFMLGLMLGYVMLYGKNIIYPMLLHFVNNLIVVITSFVYTLNNIDVDAEPIYNTAWDYVYPILMLILAAVIVVGDIYLVRYLDKQEQIKKNSLKVQNNNDQNISDNQNANEQNINDEDKNASKPQTNNKKSKNKAIIVNENSIIESNKTENLNKTDNLKNSNEQTNEKFLNEDVNLELTKEEKIFVWCSIGLGLFLWITNTIMQFFGL